MDILQRYYIVDDGKIINPKLYESIHYCGYSYTRNNVKRLATINKKSYNQITIYTDDDYNYIIKFLIWKTNINGNIKHVKLNELDDYQIDNILNILKTPYYRGYLYEHKKKIISILSNYTRYRKILKIKNRMI